MSITLKILLAVDAVLLVALIAYVLVGMFRKDAAVAVEAPATEPEAAPVVEEVKPEPVVAEEVKEEAPAAVEEVAVAEEAEAVVEDKDDDREVSRRVPFAEKMLFIDKKTQSYYNVINNKFRSLRKINIRVSSKGVSFRLGRELVAKLTVRGKTMKLHLALDVNAFDAKIYFQKDLSDVKAYAEVPCTVKVKSDRGLKNALKLVDALIESKGIEAKTRYTETDGIEDLKAIALKNR